MRLVLAAACSIWLALVPFTASALGLGDIKLDSALNQPFAAEIPLDSADESEIVDLTVELASRDTFERYGLDRPAFLSDFQFAIKTDSSGLTYIELTSDNPVAEPFVSILLDVKWSSGRLLREYTVLLDPPVFEEAVIQPAVIPAQTASAVPAESIGAVTRSAPSQPEVITPTGLFQAPVQTTETVVAQEPINAPAAEPITPVSEEPAVPALQQPARPASDPNAYIAQKGDTLWRIAERTRGTSGISNNQMMLALYRANPDAFLGNINELKAGSILRVPEATEILDVTPEQATAEVKQQHVDWNDNVQGAEGARLELVAPDEPTIGGTQSGAAVDAGLSDQSEQLQSQVGELETQLAESQRLLQLRDAELLALQQRVAELEQVQAVSQADELSAESLGEDVPEEAPLTDPADIFADDAVSTEEPVGEVVDEVVEETVEVTSDPTTVVSTPVEEPSFISSLFANVWFWTGTGALLLVGLFLVRRRNVDESSEGWEDSAEDFASQTYADVPASDDSAALEEGTEDIFAPAADDQTEAEQIFTDADQSDVEDGPEAVPLEDATAGDIAFDTVKSDAGVSADLQDEETEAGVETDDETETPLEKTISTGAPLNLDQADPIAEAEFHMAYGLYDQAADLLARALETEPDNRAYRVKLIEVFSVWENKEGFLEQSTLLHEAVDGEADSDWNKVLILGKQPCPDEAIFAGDATAAPTPDSMDLELTDAGETDLDFSLGGNEVQALDMDLPVGDEDDDIDIDLGIDFGEEAGESAAADLGLDLDTDQSSDIAATQESPTIDIYGADSPTVEANFSEMSGSTMETPTLESPMLDGADGDSASTMETPTLESPMLDGADGDSASTMETPTLESPMLEPTVEIPAADDAASTMETPTIEAAGPEVATTEMPSLDISDFDNADADAEGLSSAGVEDIKDPTSIDVDLSGLADFEQDVSPTALESVADFEDLDEDEATIASDSDDPVELLSETDNAQDSEDIAESSDKPELTEDGGQGSVSEQSPGEIDLDFSADEIASGTVEQPQIENVTGDTAEQPALNAVDGDVDFDLGGDVEVDTFAADELASVPDDATMTEVGTKLDLARAYIDMGDPEGARSILSEVLDEGGQSQQQEARQLLEELTD